MTGSIIAAADSQNHIHLLQISMAGLSSIGYLTGHQSMVSAMVFTGEASRKMISVGQDRALVLWDLKTRAPLKRPSITSIAVALDISFTESYFVTGHKNGDQKLWSVTDCKEIKKAASLHTS